MSRATTSKRLILAGAAIVSIGLVTYRLLPRGDETPWSIGVFTGSTPFDLTDSAEVANPVLTAVDVTDAEATFVADPFLLIDDDRYYMFFEVLNRATAQGDIAYATSSNGLQWEYEKIVVDEGFHLSYPYVFEWDGRIYMIPESHEDLSIRLYVASSFPQEWEYLGKLMSGQHFVDPSIFRKNGRWWMFASVRGKDDLNLYSSDELQGVWTPHPMNPIVEGDRDVSRPGGRVFSYHGRTFRLTQDGDPSYGVQVFCFELTELTETTYAEVLVSAEPLVTASGQGWNAAGMHHLDPHRLADGWIAAVDGREH